jgi:hypothetical protein
MVAAWPKNDKDFWSQEQNGQERDGQAWNYAMLGGGQDSRIEVPLPILCNRNGSSRQTAPVFISANAFFACIYRKFV